MPTVETRVVQIRIDSSKAAQQLRSIDKNLDRTRKSAQGIEAAFTRLNRVMGVIALAGIGGGLVRGLVQMVDQYSELEGRVGLVAENTVGLSQAMADLNATALTTFSSFEGAASLYTRLGVATEQMGIAHNDLISVVQLTADTLRLSGASAKESAAFMTQFSQAMASGKFAGDEFRSMLESNVFMSKLLADALETDIGGLRAMAEAGKLTTDVVLNALLPAVDKVREQASDLPITVSRAWTNLTTATQNFLSAMNDVLPVMDALAGFVNTIALGLNSIAEVMRQLSEGPTLDERFATMQRSIIELTSVLDQELETLNRQISMQLPETVQAITMARITDLRRQVEGYRATLRELNQASGADVSGPSGPVGDRKIETLKLTNEQPVSLFSDQLDRYSASLSEATDQEALTIEKTKILINTFESGVLSAEKFRTEFENLYPEIELVSEAEQEAIGWTDALSTALGNTLASATGTAANAIVDFAVRGEQSFSNMAQSILESVAQMIIQMALLRSLFGATGSGGLLGGFLPGPTTASADGNAFQGGNVVPFARGGVISQPTMFPMANGAGLAGEAGPEAIMPLSRDRNGRLGVSGGGTVVNIENHSGETAEVQRSNGPDNAEIIDVIIGQVASSISSGGAPAQAIENTYGIRRAGYQR